MELDRRYLLDGLHRSLVMLSPGAPAMNREEAMKLVAELEETEARLGRLIAELRRRPTRPKLAILEAVVPDLAPMLADRGLPAGSLDGWSAEPKLDGWRVTVRVADGQVLVRTRHGHTLTEALPGIDALAQAGDDLLVDGELVGGAGRASEFYALAPRLAGRPRRPGPRLSFWAFDLLYAQGELLTGLPYAARRARLEALVLAEPCHILPCWPGTDAADLLDACAHLDVEGVVLKRLRSVYHPGVRSRYWRNMCSGSYRCLRRQGRVIIAADACVGDRLRAVRHRQQFRNSWFLGRGPVRRERAFVSQVAWRALKTRSV